MRRSFISDAENRARLPVALLSGFLGSGKTTLANALLRDPRLADTAVAVNEFGDVPLDHELIEQDGDRMLVLANGCLCCNLAGDLDSAVMRLFGRRGTGGVPAFRRLIVEPSGLSDPAPIAQAILRNPALARLLRLEAIVTAVDAVFGLAQLGRHAETAKQVALADCLVLTKTDLAADDAALRRALRERNPTAPILLARHGAVEAAALFPESFLDPEAPPTRRNVLFAEAAEADPHGDIQAVSLTAPRPLNWPKFELWLRGIRLGHADRLLRLKGMLEVAGAAGPVVLHGVHHVLHPPIELVVWPQGARNSRLVLIVEGEVVGLRESWRQALPGLMLD